MKKLFLCLVLCWFATGAFSQKIYFAYLQSESGQPFFVRMNDKVHSSTGSGYLILSRLLDSNYSISLGFPGQNLPEQKFSIAVNKKDHGYLLKDFGEKGWGLFDLQSLNVQMSSSAIAGSKPADNNDVSPFTQILSKAADDPSLKEKTVKTEEIKKEEVVQQPPKSQEPAPVVTTAPVTNPGITNAVTIAKDETEKKEPVKEKEEVKTVTPVEKPATEPVKKDEPPALTEKPAVTENTEEVYKPSQVNKINESKDNEGHNLVFVDKFPDGKTDTIRVQIPAAINKTTPGAEKPKEEKKFLDIAVEPAKQTEVPVSSQEVTVKEEVKPVADEPRKSTLKNTCAGTASESDFLKLRRKMAAASNDDEMISEARKYFKSNCFSVYQIRNLSTLFLGDEGKYKFFDAAYPFSSDAHNFISLQLELKESYYINRFKAMIK